MKISLHFSILLSSQNLYYKCQDKIHPVELKKKNQSRFVSQYENLTLKAPIMTAADDIYKYFFIVFFSEKIRLDISCESLLGKEDLIFHVNPLLDRGFT